MKHPILWLIGGLCVGSGILSGLMGGFGVEGGDVATTFSTLGYDAVDDLQVRANGMMALVLFFSGLGFLVAANRSAWQETGGY
jgi:hypothetical protein